MPFFGEPFRRPYEALFADIGLYYVVQDAGVELARRLQNLHRVHRARAAHRQRFP
jgi:hypothetical protein